MIFFGDNSRLHYLLHHFQVKYPIKVLEIIFLKVICFLLFVRLSIFQSLKVGSINILNIYNLDKITNFLETAHFLFFVEEKFLNRHV